MPRNVRRRSRKRSKRNKRTLKRRRVSRRSRKTRMRGFKKSKAIGIRTLRSRTVRRFRSVPEQSFPSRALVNLDYIWTFMSQETTAGDPNPSQFSLLRGNSPWDPSWSASNRSATNWGFWAAKYLFYRCHRSTLSVSVHFAPVYQDPTVLPPALNDVIVGVYAYAYLTGGTDPFPDMTPTELTLDQMKSYSGCVMKEGVLQTYDGKGPTLSLKVTGDLSAIAGDSYFKYEDPPTTISNPQSGFTWKTGCYRRSLVSGAPLTDTGSFRPTWKLVVRYPTTFFGLQASAEKSQDYTPTELEAPAARPEDVVIPGFSRDHRAVHEPDGMANDGSVVPVMEWLPATVTTQPTVYAPIG